MTRYVDWVKGLPGQRMFAASPIAFDGGWIDFYLRRFTRYGLVQGPEEEDKIFDGPGLCIRSYAAAVTGRPVASRRQNATCCSQRGSQAEWAS